MTHASAPTRADVAIRPAVPTFLVADVARTARWYAEYLGLHIAGPSEGQGSRLSTPASAAWVHVRGAQPKTPGR